MGLFSKIFKKADAHSSKVHQTIITSESSNQNIHPSSQSNIPDEIPVSVSLSSKSPVVSALPYVGEIMDLGRYVVLDFETTGLSPQCNDIIEIAALKIDESGNEVDSLSTLINPQYSITTKISQLTGITNDMLIDAPCILDVIGNLYSFLKDYPIVAHNAPFDVSFLIAALKKAGISAEIYYIDTVKLAKQAYPNLPNYRLSTLIKQLEISNVQKHRAMSDVYQTNILFQKCREQIVNTKNSKVFIEAELDSLNDENFRKGYTYWTKGESERINGDIESALEFFDQARAAGYTYPAIYESYAKAYRKIKDYKREIEILDEAIQCCGIHKAEMFLERKNRAQMLMVAQEKRLADNLKRDLEKKQRADRTQKEKEDQSLGLKKSCKKAIIQYTDNGTIIEEFESITLAAQKIGIAPKCIRDAAHGIQKHAGGFCWKYAESDSFEADTSGQTSGPSTRGGIK